MCRDPEVSATHLATVVILTVVVPIITSCALIIVPVWIVIRVLLVVLVFVVGIWLSVLVASVASPVPTVERKERSVTVLLKIN